MKKGLEKTRFCKLSPKEFEDEAQTFVELVAKPKFVCIKCQRVSAERQNLCKPVKLKKLAKC